MRIRAIDRGEFEMAIAWLQVNVSVHRNFKASPSYDRTTAI